MKLPLRLSALVLTSIVLVACHGSDREIRDETSPPVQSEEHPPSPQHPGAPAPPLQPPAAAQPPVEPAPATPAAPVTTTLVAANPVKELGCEHVWANGLGLAGGRVYWVVQCWKTYPRPDEHIVLSAPVRGGEVKIAAASYARLSIAAGTHVVVRYDGSGSAILQGGASLPFANGLPDSSDCTATTVSATHVHCLGGTAQTGRRLKTWAIIGQEAATTIQGVGPKIIEVGPTANELVVDGGAVVIAEHGNYFPMIGKGVPTPKRDGRIVRIDIASGLQSVLYDGLAPGALSASSGAIAWYDFKDPQSSVPNVNTSARLVVPGIGLFETTSAIYDPVWGFRETLVDADATGTVLWAGTREPANDLSLAPNVRVRYVVHAPEMPRYLAVDGTHVYWLTKEGVFRRAK